MNPEKLKDQQVKPNAAQHENVLQDEPFRPNIHDGYIYSYKSKKQVEE